MLLGFVCRLSAYCISFVGLFPVGAGEFRIVTGFAVVFSKIFIHR